MQADTILGAAEVEQLLALGAVGDIALCFFGADGRPVEYEIDVLVTDEQNARLLSAGEEA